MGIVNAFRALGHKVKLLSLPGSDPEHEESVKPETRTSESLFAHSLRKLMELTKHVPEFVFELVELAYNLVAFFRLWRATGAPGVNMVYERYSLFMFAGILVARLRKIPILLEVNDSAIVERVRPLFFRRLARSIEAWIFRHCDGLVFISTPFQKKVLQAYGDIAPSVICPNAADLSRFSLEGIDRVKQKEKLGVADRVVCGYVGAFVYWHGIDWFVREIAPRLKEQTNLALLLVGDGVVFEEIQQLVAQHGLQDQVLLPGRIPHEQVRDYIAAMDYGILPDSNDYGSPMKLFEMMAMGVALVSPAFGPIEEVLIDNENGWLFPPKNKTAAVEKVLSLASDLENIERVGRGAQGYIERERQWTHNVERILGLLP